MAFDDAMYEEAEMGSNAEVKRWSLSILLMVHPEPFRV